jgi:hypothetical protein
MLQADCIIQASAFSHNFSKFAPNVITSPFAILAVNSRFPPLKIHEINLVHQLLKSQSLSIIVTIVLPDNIQVAGIVIFVFPTSQFNS